MFTKKHYKAIAGVIKLAYAPGCDSKGNSRRLTDDEEDAARNMKAAVSNDLADYFAKDNPQFDRDRFLAACGIEVFTAEDAHHALTGE